MGNQTICNCIYAKKLDKHLNIESNENTQEKQNNEEIIFLILIIILQILLIVKN